MLTRHPHTPAHLFLDDTPYFMTGAIYQKRPLLAGSDIKYRLHTLLQTYQWELHHWVILDNHYHWLGRSRKGKDLSRIINKIHSQSGFLISQLTRCPAPIWWNYWDYCPRNQSEYITRCNYLLYNPAKHGYVTDLHDYPFSSFHALSAELGREQLVKQFQDYPGYKSLVLYEAEQDDF